MARSRALEDMMQSYPFWVFDASVFGTTFPVFDPALGFSGVSAPEISIEEQAIQPGNWEYKRRVVKTADVGVITMRRGARFYDSDFYKWITAAVRGDAYMRRTLVLVQFMGYRPARQLASLDPGFSGFGTGIAVDSLVERLPGRAWILHDAIPTRYRPGDDLDATSSAVSIQELDVHPEYVTEITTATSSSFVSSVTSSSVAIGNALSALF